MAYKSNTETEKLLDDCINMIPPGNAIWLTIANHYLESNQYENGIEAFNKYSQENPSKTSGYYAIASKLYEMELDNIRVKNRKNIILITALTLLALLAMLLL